MVVKINTKMVKNCFEIQIEIATKFDFKLVYTKIVENIRQSLWQNFCKISKTKKFTMTTLNFKIIY